jgi:hypothetical protein
MARLTIPARDDVPQASKPILALLWQIHSRRFAL